MAIILDPQQHQYLRQGTHEPYAIDAGVSMTQWVDGPTSTGDVERVIVHDRLGHRGDNPDQDAQSWLQSWSQSGWEQFDRLHEHARTVAQSLGAELLLCPNSAGMLSDAVCTLNWVARGGGQQARLMLDPMGWVVESMSRDLPDHLDRIAALCVEMIEHDRVACVLVRSSAGEGMDPVSLGAGDVDPGMLVERLGPLLTRAPEIAVLEETDLGLLEAVEPR